MFNESVKMLSLIRSGEQSWDIAEKMDISIKRFRTLIRKLLALQFIGYEPHCFKYHLTVHGENVINFIDKEGNETGEPPYILIKPN